MKRYSLLVLVLCLGALFHTSQSAYAADKWLSIQTKNFLLIGNAGESDIRRVGRTLEEFRSAVAMVFPKMDQTSSVPTTILVFRNDESFKPYKPLYKGQPSNVVAFFQPGDDVNYIAVQANLAAPNVVLHEYVHFLLRENIGGLPLWISEGLAECYSTFELGGKQNEFTLGRAPEQHVMTFSSPQRFIPLKQLLMVQDDSPEYNEESRQGMFYAESWAMVHYLVFGPDGKRRNQFAQLLTSLAKGQAFEDAFGEAFQTDYGTLEEEVREYIRKRSSWATMKVTSKESLVVDARTAATTTLSEADSEFYLGDLLLHLNRLPDAEPHLTTALSKNPNLTAAQASLAVLRVRQRRYDDALAFLKKAAEADSKNYLVNFYYANALERADSDAAGALTKTADKYETIRTYAKKSIDLAPRYVEAYALLSRADLNAGENLDEAEATLKKAISISPARGDLQFMLAQTYLRANRIPDARNVLTTIERTATNPDVKRRATTLLDQTEQTFTFTEIVAPVEKEPASKPAQPAPPARKVEETVIEAITPIRPDVEGERITGLLINLDCSNGLTLRVRSDRTTMELHSADPQTIQFLSYTAAVSDNIRCGARNPGTPVTVTYRPLPGGPGQPLVVEFTEK